jgi:trimeric autotransporter adhesin
VARSTLPRRAILAAITVVVVGGGATTAWALTRSSGPSYRTATAQSASVLQTVTSIGTVASANSASVSFPVAGTVERVPVTLGQQVTAGQTLATLDPAALQQQVDSASSTLAAAEQTLATDSASQTISASADSTATTDSLDATPLTRSAPSSPVRSHSAGPGDTGGSGGSGKGGSIGKLQQAVLSAQQAIDQLLTGAELSSCTTSASSQFTIDDVTAAGRSGDTVGVTVSFPSGTSAVLVDSSGSTVMDGAKPLAATISGNSYTFTPVASGTYSIRFTLPATSSTDATCTSAAISDMHAKLTAGDKSLDDAITALTEALEQSAATSGGAGGAPAGSGHTGSAGRAGSVSGSSAASGSRVGSSGSGSSGRVASAADLAADQAHIDAAQASLTVANQDLAAGTLTSPIPGQVADVAITTGQGVSADSPSAVITVIGNGTPVVNTTVALSNLDEVKVGQRASVTVDGDVTPIAATVSQIGIVDTTTGSTTSYPVTVQLIDPVGRLSVGAGAGVTITVKTVSDGLTVPTSAVHALGALHTVEVLAGGKVDTVRVGVGAIGDDRTQITSGLKAGQQVVLANLSEPLPSNNANPGRSGGLGRTGLTGGGLGVGNLATRRGGG